MFGSRTPLRMAICTANGQHYHAGASAQAIGLRPFAASATIEAMTENQKNPSRCIAWLSELERSSLVAVTTVPRCPGREFCSTESRNRPLLQSWLPQPERSDRWSDAREGPGTEPAAQGAILSAEALPQEPREVIQSASQPLQDRQPPEDCKPHGTHRPKAGPAQCSHRRPRGQCWCRREHLCGRDDGCQVGGGLLLAHPGVGDGLEGARLALRLLRARRHHPIVPVRVVRRRPYHLLCRGRYRAEQQSSDDGQPSVKWPCDPFQREPLSNIYPLTVCTTMPNTHVHDVRDERSCCTS